jgi:thiol:disulfide interchange protein DsbD
LVNLTAAWCITCLVNERVALSSTAVAEAMRARGVAYLKGDWTHRDPKITELLEAHGRSGVPLYLFYPPDPTASPEIWPQVLTERFVLERLERLPALAHQS